MRVQFRPNVAGSAGQKLIHWLQKNDPFVLRVAEQVVAQRRAQGLGSTVAVQGETTPGTSSYVQQIVGAIKDVIPAIAGAYTTKKVLNAQLDLARQGLPPLETSQYSPTLGVKIAVSPEGEAAAGRIAQGIVGGAVSKMWPLALLVGGGLLYVLMRPQRRGRR